MLEMWRGEKSPKHTSQSTLLHEEGLLLLVSCCCTTTPASMSMQELQG
jgi:hypothetical protein